MPEYDKQVTCKVTSTTKDQLDQLSQAAGISTGQFVRNLIEEGIRGDRQRDELKQLGEAIQELSARVIESLASQANPAANELAQGLLVLPDEFGRLAKAIGGTFENIHHELSDLRKELARMLAMLHQYRTSNRDPAAAAEFAKQITER